MKHLVYACVAAGFLLGDAACLMAQSRSYREREEKELIESAGQDWHPETLNVSGVGRMYMRVDHEAFSRLAFSGKGYLAYVPLYYFLSQAERVLLQKLAKGHQMDEASESLLANGYYHGFSKNELISFVEIDSLSGIRDPLRPYFYSEDFKSVKEPQNLSAQQQQLFWSAVWKKYHEHAIEKEYYLSCYEYESSCDNNSLAPVVIKHWKNQEAFEWRKTRQEYHDQFVGWYRSQGPKAKTAASN